MDKKFTYVICYSCLLFHCEKSLKNVKPQVQSYARPFLVSSGLFYAQSHWWFTRFLHLHLLKDVLSQSLTIFFISQMFFHFCWVILTSMKMCLILLWKTNKQINSNKPPLKSFPFPITTSSFFFFYIIVSGSSSPCPS